MYVYVYVYVYIYIYIYVYMYIYIYIYRSEGFALTGYDIPGCVEDGAWMLWENSSAVAAVAHLDFGKWPLLEFYYGIGASGVRRSIRLVERLPKVYITS